MLPGWDSPAVGSQRRLAASSSEGQLLTHSYQRGSSKNFQQKSQGQLSPAESVSLPLAPDDKDCNHLSHAVAGGIVEALVSCRIHALPS